MTHETSKENNNVFRFNVAIAAIKGEKSIDELCREFDVAKCQVYAWKKQLESEGPMLFADKRCAKNRDQETITKLNRTIEKIEAERDFLAEVFNQLS